MKQFIAMTLIALSLPIGSMAFAQEGFSPMNGGAVEGMYYRCEAMGTNQRRHWVRGENENSLIKYAQIGALRDCRRHGGINCRITHCFREYVKLDSMPYQE